jgi:hypothetical protein
MNPAEIKKPGTGPGFFTGMPGNYFSTIAVTP